LCCSILGVSKSAYYAWKSGTKSSRELKNEHLASIANNIHKESPDKGYRRINDDLKHDYGIIINDKHMLRICRKEQLKSIIKYKNEGCTISNKDPQHIAENILNREFHVDKPNEKWLTDVTEFKWSDKYTTHKIYLSAILDLYDRRIVSYVISDRNDCPLVYSTFDKAVENNPNAHPLFHSDRGVQYTSKAFYAKLKKYGMTQSMSRVGKCIDNGPMEGFWGIIKRERYYGHKFSSRESLVNMINEYIEYYNKSRVQRRLGVLTPLEKHNRYIYAA